MSGKKEEIENKKDLTDLEQSEARILQKIEKMQIQLQTSINELKDEWKEHKEELKQVKVENYKLEYCLKKEKQKRRDLGHRVRWLEDKLLENNVTMQGITESPWETEEACKEKIFGVLAKLVICDTWQEKLDIARQILIKTVRRIGVYNSLRCRPVSITFGCRSDVEYLLENKRGLGRGIFADQEYGPETKKNRRLL